MEAAKRLKDNKNQIDEYKRKYEELNKLIGNLNENVHHGIKYEKCFEEPIVG